MRRWVICLTVPVVLTACGSQPGPATPPPVHRPRRANGQPGQRQTDPPGAAGRVRGRRAGRPGQRRGPVGFRSRLDCGTAAVRGAGGTPRPPMPGPGLSASGPGGTVYVVVGSAKPDVTALADQCGQWTMDFAHTSGTANLVEAPHIDGAQTVAMTVATRTVVESGTQTRGQANTAQAYLDGHVAVVTPGDRARIGPSTAGRRLCRRSSRQDRRGGARLMPRSLGTLAQMSNPGCSPHCCASVWWRPAAGRISRPQGRYRQGVDAEIELRPDFKIAEVAPTGIDPKLLAGQKLPDSLKFDPPGCAKFATGQLFRRAPRATWRRCRPRGRATGSS